MYRWRIYLRNGGQRIIFANTKPRVPDATYIVKEH